MFAGGTRCYASTSRVSRWKRGLRPIVALWALAGFGATEIALQLGLDRLVARVTGFTAFVANFLNDWPQPSDLRDRRSFDLIRGKDVLGVGPVVIPHTGPGRA
jgi:hypothetical protein